MPDSSLEEEIESVKKEFEKIQQDAGALFVRLGVLAKKMSEVVTAPTTAVPQVLPQQQAPFAPAMPLAQASTTPATPSVVPTMPINSPPAIPPAPQSAPTQAQPVSATPAEKPTPKIQIVTTDGQSIQGDVRLEIEHEGMTYRGVMDPAAGRIRFDSPPQKTGNFIAKVLVSQQGALYQGALGVMIDAQRKMMIDRAKIVVERVA